jgi:hypothetical protein
MVAVAAHEYGNPTLIDRIDPPPLLTRIRDERSDWLAGAQLCSEGVPE